MKKIEVYEYQLKAIENALRLTANAYECRKGETCLDRQILKAEDYAKNALDGGIDRRNNTLIKEAK